MTHLQAWMVCQIPNIESMRYGQSPIGLVSLGERVDVRYNRPVYVDV
jgi:hypothetical protein